MKSPRNLFFPFIAACGLLASSLPVLAQESESFALDGTVDPEKAGWKKAGGLELKILKEGGKSFIDLDDQSDADLIILSKNIPPEMNAMIKSKGFVLEVTMKIYPGLNSQALAVNIPGTLNFMLTSFADEKTQCVNIWDDKLKKSLGGKAGGTEKFHTWKLVYRPPKGGITADDPGKAVLYVDGSSCISDIAPTGPRAGNIGYVSIGGIGPAAKQRTGRILLEKLVFRLPSEGE